MLQIDDNSEAKLPCEDKMVFDSQKQAQATALTAIWQRGIGLRPYKCRHCHLWHLTTTSFNGDQ